MGLYSAIAAELTAAGITGDALVMALDRIESKADARSAAAKRQGAYRAKKRAESVTSDVTRDAKKVSPSLSPKPPITTLSKKIPYARAKTPFPKNNFQLNETGWNLAGSLGMQSAEVDLHLDQMADYAASRNWLMFDWQAAARNWLRKAKDYGSNRQAAPRYSFADGFQKVDAVIEEMRRRENGVSEHNGEADIVVFPGLRQGATRVPVEDH